MKPLLIIDDSKAILEVICFTVEQSNSYVPYTASSYAEAESLIKQHQFFAAIVDLNLPDCEEGKAVELTTSNNIPTIVLTASLKQETRKKIGKYPIVDYIVKFDNESIFSAVYAAEALIYFESEKILIVDINNTLRKQLKKYFEILRFKVVEAISAEHALEILQQDTQFKIILTEYHLPKMNAISFIHELRAFDFSIKPIIYVTSNVSHLDVKPLALKNGAHDFFTKPLIHEELYPKIANALHMRVREETLQRYVKTVDKYVITSATDLYGNIINVSDAFCNISGYTKEELIGKNHSIVRHPDMPKEIYQDLWSTITSGRSWSGEIKNLCKDKSFYWVSVNIDPLFDNSGNISGYSAIRQDITDKKRVEELSLTDAMTGLYNRRHFNIYLKKLIKMGQREKKPVTMILLDVDYFKQYNDTYGHQKGDDVLITISASLKCLCQRGNDVPFRIGGEEFCVLSYNISGKEAENFANKIRLGIEALKIPHENNSASSYVTSSFGVFSTTADKEFNTDILYTKSDEALYIAKENGRNQVAIANS